MQDIITFLSHHLALTVSAVIILVLLFIVEFLRSKNNQSAISTTKAIQLINHEHAVVIDIRTPEQYAAGHIVDAQLFKQSDIKIKNKKLDKLKNKPLIIVCENGLDSQKIASYLLEHQYKAYVLAGGMRAWQEANIPTVKGN